jgi:hypothetical protein
MGRGTLMTRKNKYGKLKLHKWYGKHPVLSSVKKVAPERFCRICEKWRPKVNFIKNHGKSCSMGVWSDEHSYIKYAHLYGSSPSYK